MLDRISVYKLIEVFYKENASSGESRFGKCIKMIGKGTSFFFRKQDFLSQNKWMIFFTSCFLIKLVTVASG